MNKHTPGPWNILPLEGKYYGAEIEIGENSVKVWTPNYSASPFASVREIANGWEPEDGRDHVEDVQSYANACLIAAAPELLEALEKIALAASATVCNTDWIAGHARDAIAKARGAA